jgi:hypothetical protein
MKKIDKVFHQEYPVYQSSLIYRVFCFVRAMSKLYRETYKKEVKKCKHDDRVDFIVDFAIS